MPDPLAKRIGTQIRALRTSRSINFDAFVEECGFGRGYISELERGLVVPSATVLNKIASVLEVTIADLVVGDSPRDTLYRETANLRRDQVLELLDVVRRMRESSPPDS